MLLSGSIRGQPMLWPWGSEAVAALRDGAAAPYTSHAAEMASEGMLRITEPLPRPLFLSLRQVQSQAGNMLPERHASAVPWTTKVREVCTPMMNGTHRSSWGRRDVGRAFTSNAKLTRHLEHAKLRSKKNGGSGTG